MVLLGEYKDDIMGKCKHTAFVLYNELYGAYFAECERGSSYADFVRADKIIEMAKEQKMHISLLGGRWQEVGVKGSAVLVSPEEAALLVAKLRRKAELGKTLMPISTLPKKE